MFKALLKKQITGGLTVYFMAKNGKRRTKGAMFGFAVLLAFVLASVCSMFYFMADMLCLPLVAQGLGWVYFALTGGIATALGLILSIFMAKSELYEAKDNDLLFSMPIPAWMVLCARMLGLYCLTLLFEALAFLPAVLVYFLSIGFSFSTLVLSLLSLLLMPLGTLAICCVLGWLIALLSAKLPWKNLITVLLSVAFFVVYFIVYSKMNEYLTYVLNNGGVVAGNIQKWLFPLWKLGLACMGSWGAFALYALLFIGGFALVYALIAATYLRLVTTNRGGRKVKYRSKAQKQGSWLSALLKKELMRYTKNPMVALNCLLGPIFLVCMPFFLLFVEEIYLIGTIDGIDELLAMVLAIALSLFSSMTLIASASISLEGEGLWVVRSLPVKTEQILFSKAALHWLVTAIPTLFAGIFVCILLKISFWFSLSAIVVALAFATFSDLFGLALNLKMPNLHWTNEVAAVKQGMAGMIAMFSEMGIVALLVGGYFLFGRYLFAGGYLIVCSALLCTLCGLLGWWIETRGKELFEKL